jgi:hypothetical protein
LNEALFIKSARTSNLESKPLNKYVEGIHSKN